MTATTIESINVLGVELEWKLRSEETEHQYCVLLATVPAGVGIPPHQHPEQEAFYVLEGTPEFASVRSGNLVWTSAQIGDLVNIPREALHGFRNTTSKTVRVLITCEAGLGVFFEEAGIPQSRVAGVPTIEDIQRVVGIAEKLGHRFPSR